MSWTDYQIASFAFIALLAAASLALAKGIK
jgi:hypothetical protein